MTRKEKSWWAGGRFFRVWGNGPGRQLRLCLGVGGSPIRREPKRVLGSTGEVVGEAAVG